MKGGDVCAVLETRQVCESTRFVDAAGNNGTGGSGGRGIGR